MLVARKHLKTYFEVKTQKLLQMFTRSRQERKNDMVAKEDPIHKIEYSRQNVKIVSILCSTETLL